MAPGSLPFQCGACSKRFAKMDHLNRHKLSHDAARGYQCRFCPAEFHRRDALLRHWRTCGQRLKSGLPEPALPVKRAGRKQNACSRCAQLKKKCSGLVPCEMCLKKGQDCTYPRSPSTPDLGTGYASIPTHEQQQNRAEGAEFSNAEADCGALWFLEFPESLQDDVESLLSSLCSLPPSAPAPLVPPAEADPFYMEPYSATVPSIPQSGLFGPQAGTSPMTELDWNPSHMAPLLPSLTPSPIFQTCNLQFLARLTSTHGIANSFECGNALSQKQALYSAEKVGEVTRTGCTRLPRVSALEAAESWSEADEWEPPLSPTSHLLLDLNPQDIPNNESSMAESRHPSLQSTAGEIVHGIQSTIYESAKWGSTSADWPESRERACARFFSAANLDRFIHAFFALWHPNWPIFHTPTFSAAEKSPQLVAAMCLIGASLSSEKTDREGAMEWLDAVEEWVFSDPDFCEDDIPRAGSRLELVNVETRLDALRASYAIVLVLAWEGSENQMTRSRRMRFSQVICVSRSLFSFASGRASFRGERDRADIGGAWRLFALREECTRLLSYVFLLDCAFVMLNRMAPRMVTSELQFNLASPEPCFQAPDMNTWMARMREWEADRFSTLMTLSEAIDVLMQDEADTMNLWGLRNTELLNLFALTSALHNIIFHHHNGPDYKDRSVSILRALRNWIRIWGGHEATSANLVYQRPDLRSELASTGFIKYAREYWSLAVIVYERSEYTYRSRIGGNYGQGGGGYLRKFDTSDMGQIHELIVQFQNVDLSTALM